MTTQVVEANCLADKVRFLKKLHQVANEVCKNGARNPTLENAYHSYITLSILRSEVNQ